MFLHQDAAAHIRFKIGFFGGKTNLASAFTAARSLFTPEAGARDGVSRIIVTFTDGGSNVLREETLARATGSDVTVTSIIASKVCNVSGC